MTNLSLFFDVDFYHLLRRRFMVRMVEMYAKHVQNSKTWTLQLYWRSTSRMLSRRTMYRKSIHTFSIIYFFAEDLHPFSKLCFLSSQLFRKWPRTNVRTTHFAKNVNNYAFSTKPWAVAVVLAYQDSNFTVTKLLVRRLKVQNQFQLVAQATTGSKLVDIVIKLVKRFWVILKRLITALNMEQMLLQSLIGNRISGLGTNSRKILMFIGLDWRTVTDGDAIVLFWKKNVFHPRSIFFTIFKSDVVFFGQLFVDFTFFFSLFVMAT